MKKQKASGIALTLNNQLSSYSPVTIWCSERILNGIQCHLIAKDKELLCSTVLSLLSSPISTISRKDRLVLLKISAELLPSGVSPYSLPTYLSTILSQRSYFASELHSEFCLVVSRILAGVSHEQIPQRDLTNIENACGTLLEEVLSADATTISLSIPAVMECLK